MSYKLSLNEKIGVACQKRRKNCETVGDLTDFYVVGVSPCSSLVSKIALEKKCRQFLQMAKFHSIVTYGLVWQPKLMNSVKTK